MHSVHHEAFISYFDLCPDSGDIAPSVDDKAPGGLNRVLIHKLWITHNLRTPTAASLWFFMAHRPSKEVSEYLDQGQQLKKFQTTATSCQIRQFFKSLLCQSLAEPSRLVNRYIRRRLIYSSGQRKFFLKFFKL